MNIEELKIGDLVRVVKDDYIIQKRTICKVIGLSATDLSAFGGHKPVVSLLTIDTENIRSMSCENIEGIPLTKDILLKNGWVKDTHHHCLDEIPAEAYEKKDFPLTYFNVTFGKKRIQASYDSLFVRNLKYVSDLQHLLFGLGINYEIEV